MVIPTILIKFSQVISSALAFVPPFSVMQAPLKKSTKIIQVCKMRMIMAIQMMMKRKKKKLSGTIGTTSQRIIRWEGGLVAVTETEASLLGIHSNNWQRRGAKLETIDISQYLKDIIRIRVLQPCEYNSNI